MEFVEGETLSKIIERGPLPLDKALSYAVQIVDALAAAHAKGVIHRDLKPGNIIITKNGVKVLDFGLAKLSSEKLSGESAANIQTVTEPITRAGAILGTLYYMAPEQVEGKETDERSDIFSFGVVFYEMITGQRPFTGDTQAAVLAALLKDQPPPMSQRQPATPRALERVVRKCLEKKPDDRWHSARDLKPTLELIDLDAPPASTSASASVPIPVQTPPQGKRWLWPAIAAASWSCWAPAEPTPTSTARFPFPTPSASKSVCRAAEIWEDAAVSPDGRKLAFVVRATGREHEVMDPFALHFGSPAAGRLRRCGWHSLLVPGQPLCGVRGRCEAEEDGSSRRTGPNLDDGGRWGCGRIMDPARQDRVRTVSADTRESGVRERWYGDPYNGLTESCS